MKKWKIEIECNFMKCCFDCVLLTFLHQRPLLANMHVPTCFATTPACFSTNLPDSYACQRALRAKVPTCFACQHSSTLCLPTCQCANVICMPSMVNVIRLNCGICCNIIGKELPQQFCLFFLNIFEQTIISM